MRKKVALVHDFLLKLGGAEKVLEALAEMYPDAPIHTLLYDEKTCGDVFPPDRVRVSWLQKLPAFLRKRQKFLFPLMPRAIESFDFSGYDLIISSSNAYAHGILTPSDSAHVCYCHSPMRYAWDYTHRYAGEQKAGVLTGWIIKKLIAGVRFWDKAAADRPDIYVANSAHVQKRIKKYYRLDSQVIYPPVDTDRFEISEKHEDYFLIVSALTPFKKIDLAVQLFNKTGKRLVVIGGGAQFEYLKSIAGPTVDILGRKDDATVKEYLENCRAYILPAEEDFGISPVEAMACGKPVLAYAKGGALEYVEPGVTGELFFAPTVEAMEDGLGRLIVNEPDYDRRKIRVRAEFFSKANFVKNFKKIAG